MEPDANAFLTAGVYWALIVVWSAIIYFYAREYRRLGRLRPALTALLVVLFIDGGRTLIESLYFGAWYTARTGLLPVRLYTLLAEPEYVMIPKALNLIAALLVIMVIIGRWLPAIDRTLARHRRTERLYNDLQGAHEELQRSEDAREDLVHMIVHDMRTPLTSILGGLQTVEAGGLAAEQERELLTNARRDSEALLQMVNSLLDISRMEAGEMELSLSDFSLAEVVQEAFDQLAGLSGAKRVEVTLQTPAAAPMVLADRQAIARVVANLLGNAVKFVPMGGKVAVRIAADGNGGARVTVADNGPGIPQELHERIFDKFFRGHVNDSAAPSTGLGLAYCKLAVEAHGGRIWVTSEPSHGAEFHFTIPAPRPGSPD